MPRNFENLGEVDKYLEKYNLPKLNEQEAKTLNKPITDDEIEAVITKLQTHSFWAKQFHRRIVQSI